MSFIARDTYIFPAVNGWKIMFEGVVLPYTYTTREEAETVLRSTLLLDSKPAAPGNLLTEG